MRNVVLVVAGVLIGAVVIYALVSGSRVLNQTNIPVVPIPPQVQSPQSVPGSPSGQIDLNNLRRQLYQEGMTTNTIVDTVYPGSGFIVRDEAGTKLFVHWPSATSTTLTSGQNVSIKGTVQQLSDQVKSTLSNESGYTPDLDTFLKDQRIIIEAQSVTPA